MSKSFLPSNDKALDAWALNFATVATANQAQIPLTAAEVKAISDAEKALKLTIDAQEAIQKQAKAATLAKNNAAKAVTTLASQYNARIQSVTTVPTTLKEQLGLTVRKKPSRTAPLVPINLIANGLASGINLLEWQSGGNKSGVTYVIEALYPNSTAWILVDTATTTRYSHQNQTPGVAVTYRIRARRRSNEISTPSNTASVYAMPAQPVLTLQKAS